MPPFRRLFSYVAEVKQQISSCFCTKQRKSGFSRKNPLSFSWNVWYNRYKRYVRVGKETSVMESNALLNAKLSLDSDISLYAQLVGIIKRNISTGVLAVGDLLPSEAELCRALNISRNTVRQAIGELEDEGLVVRKRGRGTFVADPSTNRRGVR